MRHDWPERRKLEIGSDVTHEDPTSPRYGTKGSVTSVNVEVVEVRWSNGEFNIYSVSELRDIRDRPASAQIGFGAIWDQRDRNLREKEMNPVIKTSKYPYSVGTVVCATKTITEAGELLGDSEATFWRDPDDHSKGTNGNYIHAVVGDIGKVEHIDDPKHPTPTVRFARTGTATIVGPDEISLAVKEDE